MSAPAHVWEGVFPSFSEAPATGLGFRDPTWRTKSLEAARAAKEVARSGGCLDQSMTQRHGVLTTLVSTLLARRAQVRVLDFGGGLGFGHLVLQSALPIGLDRLSYEIVDVDQICSDGAELFATDRSIAFRSDLPDRADVDIVFSASSIQYLADWRAICRALARYEAPFFLLSDVYAGPVDAYVTLQNYYGSKIPHWILNETELLNEIRAAGYELSLRAPCYTKILGRDGELPMEALPPEKRLKRSSHLLFSRAR